MEETKAKILEVLSSVLKGALFSATDRHRLLGADKREIRNALDELEAEDKIEIENSGRPGKPLYKLREEVRK